MTNQELLDELRGEIAKLREEIAELRTQGTRIVFVPTPAPYPVYPLYPQPYVVPWYPSPSPFDPVPHYPQISW